MPSNFIAHGAAGYEALMGRWSQRLALPFLEFAGVPADAGVLDAGCGTGSLTMALEKHRQLKAIEAVDFEEAFVAASRKRTSDPRVRIQQGDVCALPYGSNEFDAVYSMLVLHFVSDPHQAVREMRRVLRTDGIAAATVWDSQGGMPSWRLFWDTIAALEPRAAEMGPMLVPRPMSRQGELRGAFERAGFSNITDTTLTIRMDYTDFEDFWHPMVYGQGKLGAFYDALPEKQRSELRDAVRRAFLGSGPDGPRGFASMAWAVRGTAPRV